MILSLNNIFLKQSWQCSEKRVWINRMVSAGLVSGFMTEENSSSLVVAGFFYLINGVLQIEI